MKLLMILKVNFIYRHIINHPDRATSKGYPEPLVLILAQDIWCLDLENVTLL